MSSSADRSQGEGATATLAIGAGATRERRPHRWTIEQYDHLGASDVLGGQRTELLDGEILDMPPQNDSHRVAVAKVLRELISVFDSRYLVTSQATVRLKSGDAPEPDVAVEIPQPVTRGKNVRIQPLLVVEVSDETLLFDQIVKGSLYAANGIADYWILNVKEKQLEVYRDPVPDAGRRHGFRYGKQTMHRAPESVSPLTLPAAQIEVAKLLPF